jgi:peptidoglycan-associated lipoprotein
MNPRFRRVPNAIKGGIKVRRVTGVLFLVALLGCASSGGSGAGGGNKEFSEDPGLRGDSGVQPGAEASTHGMKTIYFDFDRSDLRPEAKANLEHNAGVLRSAPDLRVEVQGNCDERGSEEYNLALGQRRADTAKQYLVDLGVEGGRIRTVSFGEENPAVRGHDESVWSKNRRDDFVGSR